VLPPPFTPPLPDELKRLKEACAHPKERIVIVVRDATLLVVGVVVDAGNAPRAARGCNENTLSGRGRGRERGANWTYARARGQPTDVPAAAPRWARARRHAKFAIAYNVDVAAASYSEGPSDIGGSRVVLLVNLRSTLHAPLAIN